MMKKISAVIFTAVLLAAFASAGSGAAEAQKEKQAVKRTAFRKTVQGEVGGIGSGFIAITYEVDAQHGSSRDMLFPIDENTTLQNKRTLKQIRVGDTAAVEYSEVTEDGKIRRRAEKIIFVKAATTPVESSTLGSEYYVPPEDVETAEPKDDKGENTDE